MQKQKRNAAYWPIPCGLFNFLSYNTKGHLLLDDTSHSELGPSTSSSIKNPPPQCCSQANNSEGIFSIEVSSIQMTVTCIKLT